VEASSKVGGVHASFSAFPQCAPAVGTVSAALSALSCSFSGTTGYLFPSSGEDGERDWEREDDSRYARNQARVSDAALG